MFLAVFWYPPPGGEIGLCRKITFGTGLRTGLAQTAEKCAMPGSIPADTELSQMYNIYVKSFINLFSWGQRGSYVLVLYLGNYEWIIW
jgi:hypothetical protein